VPYVLYCFEALNHALNEYQGVGSGISGNQRCRRDWLSQFAEALENPEILTRFNKLYETV